MATKLQLRKQEENLTDVNMKKVIGLLQGSEVAKPITKTEACRILCISYNVKRLDTLVERFIEKEAYREKRMSENRGKPANPEEIRLIIREYLGDSNVTAIAKTLFRGTTFVNSVLESCKVPVRPNTSNYFKPELIPDDLVRHEFAVGEVVYSARYDSLAKIRSLYQEIDGQKVYSIFLIDDKWQMNAYQPVCELASLEHLKEYGVSYA